MLASGGSAGDLADVPPEELWHDAESGDGVDEPLFENGASEPLQARAAEPVST